MAYIGSHQNSTTNTARLVPKKVIAMMQSQTIQYGARYSLIMHYQTRRTRQTSSRLLSPLINRCSSVVMLSHDSFEIFAISNGHPNTRSLLNV